MAHHSSPITRHFQNKEAALSADVLRRVLAPLCDLELLWGKPLAQLTTFRIGGPVTCVARPLNESALHALLEALRNGGVPYFVLGGGSNVLAPDDPWDVVIVQLNRSAEEIQLLKGEPDGAGQLRTGGGVRLSTLLGFSVRKGLGGLEPLVGIPGTVGGAVVMNAGTKEGSVADRLLWVDLLDDEGRRKRLLRHDMKPEYRHMGIPERWTVLSACFRVEAASGTSLRRKMAGSMKRRKETQPMGWPSAGCIFKNPPGEISAGALIDEAGLKGFRIGDAEVSRKHANWIINGGNARAADVLALIEHVEEAVFLRCDIRLEREIRVLGR